MPSGMLEVLPNELTPLGHVTRAGGLGPSADHSGTSFARHIHRPFDPAGRSDDDDQLRRCAAWQIDASSPVPDNVSKKSVHHRFIANSPVIEPTGEKGFGPAVQQTLKRGQKNVRRLGFG